MLECVSNCLIHDFLISVVAYPSNPSTFVLLNFSLVVCYWDSIDPLGLICSPAEAIVAEPRYFWRIDR